MLFYCSYLLVQMLAFFINTTIFSVLVPGLLTTSFLQVDLTEYVEKHEFVFDAVMNEEVSNDEASIS